MFTIVAVLTMGLAVFSYQNAAATIISSGQDAARDAIRGAQNALESLDATSILDNKTRAIVAEGQEGLDNASSALNNLPSGMSVSPSGQSSDSLGQGTGSLENSKSLPSLQ